MLGYLNQIISLVLSNPLTRILVTIVSGVALGLSSAGYGFGFYAWFGLIPLLLLIKSSRSFYNCFTESLLFLFTFNATCFVWLLNLHPLTWQGFSNQESLLISSLAWLIPSIFHSLILLPFILVTKLFFEYRSDERTSELKVLDIIAIAFIWVVIEYKLLLNLGPDLGAFIVPINLLAYSQYKNLYLIQICNIIGSIGLEFLLVFTNVFLANLFNVQKLQSEHKVFGSKFNILKPYFGLEKMPEHLKTGAILLLVFLAIYGYGFTHLNNYTNLEKSQRSKLQSAAIVQADYSAASTRQNPSPAKLIKSQLKLSSTIHHFFDFLIWSEGSVPIELKQTELPSALLQLRYTAKNFAFGSFAGENNQVFNSLAMLQFKIHDNFELKEYEQSFYHKNLLVPFGEYTPLYELLPASLKKIADHNIGNGFAKSQQTQTNLITQNIKLAPSICFELLFPELIRKHVTEGGEAVININDLSWFNSKYLRFTKELVNKLFFAAAVFRAVENHRYLLLAGNTGYSAIITPTGYAKAKSQANKIDILESYFLPIKAQSIYTKYGW